MPHIYPPAPPTLTGDTLTISRFLNSPALVQRRLRDITSQRFIADVLLTGRYESSGGSLLYEQNESIYTAKPPEAVGAGAEYPRSSAAPGPAALAAVTKWGQDVPVTDEHVARYGRRAVDVAMLKIRNYLVKQVDSVALTAIGAATTQQVDTAPNGGAWSSSTADPFLCLELAKATILANDQGYDPDTAVMSDTLYARLVANQKVIAGLAREATNSVTATGQILRIADLRILSTNNLPAGIQVFVCDSTLLGGLGYERLQSPEYQGDPANGVESWSRRDPAANDQWLLRGRRPVVPIVQEPLAACKVINV